MPEDLNTQDWKDHLRKVSPQLSQEPVDHIAEMLTLFKIPAPAEDSNVDSHDRQWWIDNANLSDAGDCDACIDDLCPVHHGIGVGIDMVMGKLAALVDDPELFALIPDLPADAADDSDV